MDKDIFLEWLKESRAGKNDAYGRQRNTFFDNCGAHKVTDEHKEQLNRFKKTLLFLPPNSTDLCQPCDSFVINKIKERW